MSGPRNYTFYREAKTDWPSLRVAMLRAIKAMEKPKDLYWAFHGYKNYRKKSEKIRLETIALLEQRIAEISKDQSPLTAVEKFRAESKAATAAKKAWG